MDIENLNEEIRRGQDLNNPWYRLWAHWRETFEDVVLRPRRDDKQRILQDGRVIWAESGYSMDGILKEKK